MPAAVAEARRRIEQAVNQFGPSCVAVAVSAGSSLETIAVGQYLCVQNNWTGPVVAQTTRQVLNMQSAVQHLKPELAVSLGAVSVADEAVVLGADPLNEAPMLALSLRQAWRQGAHVTVIDPRGVWLPFDIDHWAVHPSALDRVVREMVERIKTGALPDTPGASSPRPVSALADRLVRSRRTVVVCGADIVTPQTIAAAADLTEALRSKGTEAKLFFTMAEANAFAAGLTSGQCSSMEQLLDLIEAGRIRVLVVVEDDPWRQYPDRRRLEAALQRLDHLIVLGHVATALNQHAGCFLPTQTLYESGGCWINQEGRLQAARPVMAGGESIEISGRGDHPPRVFESRIPGGEPQAAWRILLALGRRLDNAAADDDGVQLKAALQNFHPAVAATYHTPDQRIALDAVARAHQRDLPSGSSGYPPTEDNMTVLLVDWTFGTMAPADMSPALNAIAEPPVARLHPQDIARLQLGEEQQITLQTGSGRLTLPVKADARMAPGVMVIPRHRLLDWQLLGQTRFSLERGRIRAAEATVAP
jgi:NADH-quinone oxidoreductase subunit G